MTAGIAVVLWTAAVGVGATALMDVWNAALKLAFGIPSLSFCMLGRWIRHFPEGRFRHANLASAARKPQECATGWLAHYSIGIGFALAFVTLASSEWLEQPTLLPALAWGASTVVAPYLVLQPAFGLGVAASKTADPTSARLKSFVTHLVFGIGLYLSGLVAACLR